MADVIVTDVMDTTAIEDDNFMVRWKLGDHEDYPTPLSRLKDYYTDGVPAAIQAAIDALPNGVSIVDWDATTRILSVVKDDGSYRDIPIPTGNPTDAEIGDKAFSNPPGDLTDGEKTAAREAIGAGTGSGNADGKLDADLGNVATVSLADAKAFFDALGANAFDGAGEINAAAQAHIKEGLGISLVGFRGVYSASTQYKFGEIVYFLRPSSEPGGTDQVEFWRRGPGHDTTVGIAPGALDQGGNTVWYKDYPAETDPTQDTTLLKGAWQASNTQYRKGDIVDHDGKLWIAIADNVNTEPSHAQTSPWYEFVNAYNYRGNAPAAATHYRVGDIVVVANIEYRCIVPVTTTATLIPDNTVAFRRIDGSPAPATAFINVPPGEDEPRPVAGNVDKLIVSGIAAARTIKHQVVELGTGLVVTYRDFNSSDLSSGTFVGSRESFDELPDDATTGQVYWVADTRLLYLWTGSDWGNVFFVDLSGDYMGDFQSEEQATHSIGAHYPSGETGTPVGNYISWGENLKTVIAPYTATTADHRTWEPIFEVSESTGLVVHGTPADNQIPKWNFSESRAEWARDETAQAGQGVDQASVDTSIEAHNTSADAHANRIQTDTQPQSGEGGLLPTIAVVNARFHRKGGTDVPVGDGGTGASTASAARNNLGLGSAATKHVGLASGNVPELGSGGKLNLLTILEHALSSYGNGLQLLGNHTQTDRIGVFDGNDLIKDLVGTWLAAQIDEITYDSTTKRITFQETTVVNSDHFKGEWDNTTTYEAGNVVSHNSEFWIVHDVSLANANEPGSDTEDLTGWSQVSDTHGFKGSFENTDTTERTFAPGDYVYIETPYNDYFFAKRANTISPSGIHNSPNWERFITEIIVTGGAVATAISGSRTDGAVIFYNGAPENRLTYYPTLTALEKLLDELSPSASQVLRRNADDDAYEFADPSGGGDGISEADADAKYLIKNPAGTTTVQQIEDPIVIDVSGNQEAFKIQAHAVTNSAIFKIETPDSGNQKAFQANREGQNLAFLEFGGATGGSGKAGIAIGSGTGGRDTNLYREEANHLKTDDALTVGGNLNVDGDMNIAVSDVPDLPASKITSGTISAARLPSGIGGASPSGAVTMFAGATAPTGWLLCDGSAVSRATYSALYAVIGDTYGDGDGSTTFELPDMRNSFGAGAGDDYSLGDTGGEKEHALTIAEMPSHDHSYNEPQRRREAESGNEDRAFWTNETTSVTTGSTGGGQAHNNVPPFVAMNFIIKT